MCAKKTKQKRKTRKRPSDEDDGFKTVARNRKARHRFHILDTFEAGLALTGNEVKSLREGSVSLDESYGRVVREAPPKRRGALRHGRGDGEVFLVGCHISPYKKTGFDQPEPTRSRKLLLKKSEIRRISGKVVERGFTLVPLRVYFKGPWAKVELALARGKGYADKREDVKKRDQQRDMARALRGRGRKTRRGGR